MLNFLSKVVFPGRVFTRCMYAKFAHCMYLPSFNSPALTEEEKNLTKKQYKLKQHHHIRLDAEFKADCKVWMSFLTTEHEEINAINRPMVDLLSPALTSEVIKFFSDATAAENLGYGCVLNNNWLHGYWEPGFIKNFKPSIEYLELFVLCAGVLTWQFQLTNCRIIIFCDNQAVVQMINNITSSCRNCMFLLRILVLNPLQYNRRITARFIASRDNQLADALSRGQLARFYKIAPVGVNKLPDQIHPDLWPLSKLWQA